MDRLLLAYAPWRLGVHRVFNHLQYPWVKGYKKHPILYTNFKYLDIDVAARQAAASSCGARVVIRRGARGRRDRRARPPRAPHSPGSRPCARR